MACGKLFWGCGKPYGNCVKLSKITGNGGQLRCGKPQRGQKRKCDALRGQLFRFWACVEKEGVVLMKKTPKVGGQKAHCS
jgi:hypothetical protein